MPPSFRSMSPCCTSLRDYFYSIDLGVLLAEGEGDVELAVSHGDGDGFHQCFASAAGFFEDVQVLDRLVFNLDREDALAGLGDGGECLREVKLHLVAAIWHGGGEGGHSP